MKLLNKSLFFSLALIMSVNAQQPPINISPAEDPLLTNINNCFPQPTFPATTPPDVIRAQFNSYYSPRLVVNPANPKNIAVYIRSDNFKDANGIFFRTGGTRFVAFSVDGGKTWQNSVPQPPLCLGGDVSQLPGFVDLQFGTDGKLYWFGAFNDLNTGVDSRPYTQSGYFVQVSEDGGATWSDATIIDTTTSGAFVNPTNDDGFQGGLGYLDGNGIGSILPDPLRKNVVHVSWSRIFFPSTFYGNIWYARSTDSGKTFEEISQIYDMANDPQWVIDHATPNICQVSASCPTGNCGFPDAGAFGPAPICAIGGQTVGGSLVSLPNGDCQTLLDIFIREYPFNTPDNFCYSQQPTDTIFDHALIISKDNGKTWTRQAIEIAPYLLAFSHNPTQPGTFSSIVTDGAITIATAVSPKTGRVYIAYQGGDQSVGDDCTQQFFPRIELNVSADQGQTWSPNTVVSRTSLSNGGLAPADPRNQAFNPNIAILPNGLLGVIYEDFRNFDPSQTAVVNTDVWLAVYKETADVTVNAGLEFVEEIRLTPQSFDAEIGFNSQIRGVGAFTGIAAGKGCSFLTAFGVTNEGDIPPCINPPSTACPPGIIADTNNRMNVLFERVRVEENAASKKSEALEQKAAPQAAPKKAAKFVKAVK